MRKHSFALTSVSAPDMDASGGDRTFAPHLTRHTLLEFRDPCDSSQPVFDAALAGTMKRSISCYPHPSPGV